MSKWKFLILETFDGLGLQKLWFLGDNFLASSYRIHVRKATAGEWFVKDNFEIYPFCSSKFSSKNINCLSRLQITVANGINMHAALPEVMVFVLDDNLIQYLGYKKWGVASFYGPWIEWLLEEVNKLIESKWKQLPTKMKLSKPQVYWVELPDHSNFDHVNRDARVKFNNCLLSVVKRYDNMRMICLKEGWSKMDSALVVNNHFTADGLSVYWRSIDWAV